MASNEETNAAGTDTRPPMLVESDYDSWKIRIHRYIRGKPNGKQIWKSIQNGPTPHPMITDPPPTDSAAVPAPRKKLDSEFSEEENKLEMADTQAEIILSQGLPESITPSQSLCAHAKKTLKKQEHLSNANLLSVSQSRFPPQQPLRTFLNNKTHATGMMSDCYSNHSEDGSCNNVNTVLMARSFTDEAKEKGDVLEAEAEAFLR
ncbi:hypothetical protein Tco_1319344 [Tanacetum coccineum]|uniref:DUF4219 domain-containing protein n=1 Tax=Tanacetum coccineum TaxID=301880 RepID=A0ABQ5DSM8_9ASTR